MLKLHRKLFNEFEEGQGGGGGYQEEQPYYSEEQHEEPVHQEHQQHQQPAPPSQPQGIDLDTIRAIAAEMRQPVHQEQPLTQEQIYQRMNAFRADETLASQFFGEGASPEQVSFLQSFIDNIVKHAVTISHLNQQAFADEINQRYSPLMQQARQQQEQTFTGLLTRHYPALKGKERVVGTVIQQLRASGFQPSSGEEAARVIAQQTELLLRSIDPSFSLSAQPGQQPGSMPSMPSLSGGGGGGGPARTTQKKKPAWASVFD